MLMPSRRIVALLSLALLLPAAQAQAQIQTQPQTEAAPQLDAAPIQPNQLRNCAVNTITRAHDCTLQVFTFNRRTGNGNTVETAHHTELTTVGPALSIGDIGGWRVQHIDYDVLNVATRGIAQGHTLFFNKHAVGDTMGSYDYVYSDGGNIALADEAIKGHALGTGENTGYFHGTIASTTGPGDIQPSLKFVSGNNWTTDGAPLLDISKGRIAGHITGPSAPLPGTYLNTFPVDNILPVTTAWGICNTVVPTARLAQTNQPFTCDVTVKMGRFDPKGLVCVSGPNYPEQAPITSASEPSNGVQTLTLQLRNPNASGAVILQGGPCGQYISFDANLAATGYRSSYYAFGATDPHHLIYGMNIQGVFTGHTLPMGGGSEAEQFGVDGRNGYHLYPGCEVVTNLTYAANPICEPNTVPWEQGDLIEAPHNVSVNTVGNFTGVTQNTPANGGLSSGDFLVIKGPGTSGRNFIAHRTLNGNPNSLYTPYGGIFTAPDLERIEGYFDIGFEFVEAPGTVIRVTADAAHAKTPITLFSLPGGDIKWDPSTQTLLAKTSLHGTTNSIGGSPLAIGTCATGTATIPGASKTMIPVTVASATGAPGFSPTGAFQVNAQVTAPNTVTVNVCAILAGTPHPSTYLVSLQ